MNAPLIKGSQLSGSQSNGSQLQLVILQASMIKQAKSQAQLQQRRPIEVLEEMLGCKQEEFLQALCAALDFTAVSMKELHSLTPAFELISFAKAQQKECLAFYKVTNFDEQSSEQINSNNAEAELILVFADPLN